MLLLCAIGRPGAGPGASGLGAWTGIAMKTLGSNEKLETSFYVVLFSQSGLEPLPPLKY